MAYSRDEQETVCVYDSLTGRWTVYSTVRKHITKLLRRFGEPEWKEEELDIHGNPRIIAAKWTVGGNAVRFASNRAQNEDLEKQEGEQVKTIANHY